MPAPWKSVCFLHGLGSSPQGTKAVYFGQRFEEEGLAFAAPDLNVPSFSEQTITAQLEVVRQRLETLPVPVLLMGSSFGGLLAIRFSELHSEQVGGVVLIAPVTKLRGEALAASSGTTLLKWKASGALQFCLDGETMARPLLYGLVEDAVQHQVSDVRLRMPVLAIHGAKDVLIPWQETDRFASRQYSGSSSLLMSGDHSLNDKLDVLWTLIGNWRFRIASETRSS